MRRIAVFGLASLVVVAVGCKSQPPPPPPTTTTTTTTTMPGPVAVAAVTLGKEIDADKRVVAPMEAFAPADTVYASVETTGVGPAKLRALWSFVKGEKTAQVDETTIEMEATGPAVNEFHVSKPSGWPTGDYKVEIFLGDETEPAQTRTFTVN